MPICDDPDTERLLRIAASNLVHFFQYSETKADELVRSFYARWRSPGWDDDFYHHEGAFRSAALMHYSALHGGSTDFTHFTGWYHEQQLDVPAREALEYFRENYFRRD